MTPYYSHAGITIYHGDCREIIPQLACFDLLLTDPPYGCGENSKRVASRGKLAQATDYGDFDWDSEPASDSEIESCRTRGGRQIIWGGNYFSLPPSKCWLVWDKLNGSNDFADCELAWTNLPGAVRKFPFLWNGMIRAGRDSGITRVHPTQKPVELMKWCIARAGAVKSILDPFMGSGTTLVAAKDEGIAAVGCDAEERYCEIAAKRLSQEVMDFGLASNGK